MHKKNCEMIQGTSFTWLLQACKTHVLCKNGSVDHSYDTDLVVQQHMQIHQVGKCQMVGRPPNCSQAHQVERHAFVVWIRAKGGRTQLGHSLLFFSDRKEGQTHECTHVFGNATLSNIIRKNSSSAKCEYSVYSVRYVERMFLYCPNHIYKQKGSKNTWHAL